MAQLQVKLNFFSRLKRTNLYTANGTTFYGVWKKPQIEVDGNEKVISLPTGKSLEHIAFQEYGKRELWWAIAQVNGIRNVFDELKPGMQLRIPKENNIRDALVVESTQNATGI